MADVVVVPSPQSAPSAPSALSADNAVPAEIVETIHDDAMLTGGLIERVNTLEARMDRELAELRDQLAAQNAAAIDAVESIVETVEEIADAVEDTTAPEIIEETVNETPDTPPGKTHWLHRTKNEWRGRE